MKKKLVRNMNTLKAMAKANLIKLCDQTGEKIRGLYSDRTFTCYYIDEAINARRFDYKGKKYEVEYVDGCFMPYVFQIQ